MSAIKRTDGNARHWMVENGFGEVGSEAETVRRSRRPLAVVHGTRDAFINPGYQKTLKYRALWIQFFDAGRAPRWQRPRLFNKLLLQFLEETCA
jgi:pimeloyl-ACP methyl ester carboxylesterase